MTEVNDIVTAVKGWAPVITAAGTALAFVVGLWKYLGERSESHRWKEFEVYHKLVQELVEPAEPDKPMFIDRQAAVVYELAQFKRYRPCTLRMLRGLRDEWSQGASQIRLIKEIDAAIDSLAAQAICFRNVKQR